MQSKEYLEKKRADLKADLESTLKSSREHVAKEEQEIRDKQQALNDFAKQAQRRVSQLEGAIMGFNEALAEPTEEKAEAPSTAQPESAKQPDAPTSNAA